MKAFWIWSLLIVACSLVLMSGGDSPRRRPPLARRPTKKQQGNNRQRGRSDWANNPDKYLEKFGYLGSVADGTQHDPASRKAAIKGFQRMAGLTPSGRLDQATLDMMAAPRCGMADQVPASSVLPPPGVAFDAPKTPENFYVPGYKWKKTRLTWQAVNYSPDLSSGVQRLAFSNAFKVWSDVTPLQFQEVGGGTPDIEIKFGSYAHNDPGNDFDGPGGILAHAFYPENGDTHFDESETWVDGEGDGTDIFTVAAHEFGHAMGLGHSNVRGALMAPFYQGYDPDFRIHDDDRQAIQSLYGSAPPRVTPKPPYKPTQPTTPRPTQSAGGKPDPCTTKFHSVMQAHDSRIYVFYGTWVWRLTDRGVEEGFPKRVTKVFPGAPYSIGAAVYSFRTRYTYFFKGNKVWQYYGFDKILRKRVTTRGYPISPHGALMGRDGRIYLMKGDRYWIFDEERMDIPDPEGRPLTAMWPGLPPNMAAAVRLRDGYLYFFKGTRYRKFDEYYRRVVPGYPKEKAAPWMGELCGGPVPK